MRDESTRLMALLRGQRAAKPPFWEPWFGMTQMLADDYGNDPLRLCDALGLAAWRIGSVSSGLDQRRHVDRDETTGVWYGGGELRDWQEITATPVPDYDAIVANLLPARERYRQAGLACWLVIPWCFHVIATNMGLEQFAMDCYDRPQFIADAMRWVEDRTALAIERVVCQVQPDFVLYDGDCAYKTGPMLHPDMLRDFVFEPTLANTHRLRQLGVPVTFHCDGKLDDVIPILIDLGIAAVHGCEKQANDLAELVAKFGDQIVLCGNMDVVFMKSATVEQVRQVTRQMLQIGSRKHRYAAATNTSPLDYIPRPNYREMAHTIANFAPAA